MIKVALLAATVLVAASTAMATNIAFESGAPPAGEAPCHLVQSLDLGCALRIVDTNNDGTISTAELANFASAAPVIDWAPLHPPHSTGLDFKDAAIEPGSVLPTTLERDASHPLMPALFALGALVVLLRKRPG
jgi:hypothetical protein